MTDQKRNVASIISVAGLIVTLGGARGLDAMIAALGHINAETFWLPLAILWAYSIANLVLAALSLLLFWLVFNRAPRSVWVAVVFVLVGLFIVTYPILFYAPGFCCWAHPLDVLLTNLLPFPSHTFTAGGIIAIIGLFALVLPREKQMTAA